MSCIEAVNEKSHISAGPWGGECGTRWDDGVYCSIRQMIISHGAVIDSVQIEYDTRGCPVWSERHGGSGGIKTEKVKLDYPEEHLVSISGYYGSITECGPHVIRSLLFESNKRRYGPFGFQKGTHFSFSLTGGKIVGFHGRSTGVHLDAIGVYVKPFVSMKSAHTQSMAHNRMGLGSLGGGGGNKGFDIMVAVREKMDNMFISNGGFGEFERKEKTFTTSEAVKGSSYQTPVGKERENYVIMPNSAFCETDQSIDQKTFFRSGSAGKSNVRKPARETEGCMVGNPDRTAFSEYETREKVYTTPEGVKGRHSNPRYNANDEDFVLAPERGPIREYETREKTKVYGTGPIGTGAEKGYINMTQTESNMFVPNKVLGDYETKEQVYGTGAGAEKGYSNVRQTEGNMVMPNRGAFGKFETKEKFYNTGAQNTNGSAIGKQAVSYGPWGGNGGMLFDDGVYTGVREIHLARSGGVVSIRVCYDMNGRAVWGNKNGGNGGFRLDKITFDYPNEFLTHISGYYGSTIIRGPTAVKSLTFYTNKKKYGPFGDEQGIPFSSGQKDGIIVGFHGRKGWFVDSIGVHVLEGKHSLPRPCFDMNSTLTDIRYSDQVVSGVLPPVKGPTPCGSGLLPAGIVKDSASCGSGPWGGDRGNSWDDGVFTGIKKIFLTKGESSIYAIQIEYEHNGQSMWSVKHGSNNEGSCHMIQFEYPHEMLTGMSGYYGPVLGDECKIVIKSLTFYTNRGRYGPFGEESGTYFGSPRSEGRIVGFHGKSACYLYAIGVHMQPWIQDRPVEQGPIKTILNKIFA